MPISFKQTPNVSGILALGVCALLMGLLPRCETKNPDAGYALIPERRIDREISIKQPEFSDLNNPGGFVYLDEGYRGVIVVHSNNNKFHAFERACPYNPDKSCARISMHPSRLYLACGEIVDSQWQECIRTKYHLNGEVMEGPSDRPLKSYSLQRDGNFLRITNRRN